MTSQCICLDNLTLVRKHNLT